MTDLVLHILEMLEEENGKWNLGISCKLNTYFLSSPANDFLRQDLLQSESRSLVFMTFTLVFMTF